VVRGTEFVMEVRTNGDSEVRVSRGNVRARSHNVEITVNAGYFTRWSATEGPITPMPIPDEDEERPTGGGGASRPRAGFAANPTHGTAPLTVRFADRSRGRITAWLWDFGDGSTSTDEHPTHTYANHGRYTVSLTVSRDNRSDTETKSNYIVVHPQGGTNSTVIFGEVVPP